MPLQVTPSSSNNPSNPTPPASDFLRNKAKLLGSLHRKAKAADGDDAAVITANTEMESKRSS